MTTVDAPTATAPELDPKLGFDPKALKAKYLAERDKRLRADGNQQYQEIAGQFAHFAEDPYVEAALTRAPISEDVDVVVIGGGFGGLLTAARLKEAGVEDVRIIEKGGDFGGTWYWNRYPGAACDIESYIYLPLLEETGYMPTRKYARAAEILEHHRRIARHYGLYDKALLQTEAKRMDWDEQASRWIVSTNRGDVLRARFLALASGPLHRPKLPGVLGVDLFKGKVFHTSRWDYGYTGGGPEGELTKLADKRVGLIGTGATAVQCVPHLGRWAKSLHVFQRTPSSIDVRNDRVTDPEWVKTLEPGWQQRRMDNFTVLTTGGYEPEDLVNDGWTDIIRNILLLAQTSGPNSEGNPSPRTPEQMMELIQLADFKKMEQVRGRVDTVVSDRTTAEALKPYYNQFCKRPCFHDEYLATFNLPTVTLVDTDGKGVERITETGVVANGQEYPLDCLILGTGFEVGTGYSRRSGFEIFGVGGVELSDYWAEGLRTLHGMHSKGFPNCFVMTVAQSGFSANFPHMLGEQAKHVAYLISAARDRQATRIEATTEAEDAWIDQIKATARMRQQYLEECTPGYYNNEGQPSALAIQNGSYGAGPIAFVKLLEAWRAEGELKGLEAR